MYELLIIVAFAGLAYHNSQLRDDEFAHVSRRVGDRLGKLWDIAHQGMRENRFLRAEKALLTSKPEPVAKPEEKCAVCLGAGFLYGAREGDPGEWMQVKVSCDNCQGTGKAPVAPVRKWEADTVVGKHVLRRADELGGIKAVELKFRDLSPEVQDALNGRKYE